MRNIIFDQTPELSILYQDEFLVAINKPSGLLVHRSEIDKRETLFALQLTRDLVGQHVFPVHRLDRPTSGVLLFALSSEVAHEINQAFIEGSIEKTYLAVVRGHTPDSLEIDYALSYIHDKFADKDRDKDLPPQEAQTLLKTLAKVELPFPSGRYESSRYSLVELTPKTGRKHQLRRHMAHIRHPIIGDTNHGDGKQNKSARANLDLTRLALHAKSLSFNHPISKQNITITAPLDDALNHLINTCGWETDLQGK
ncbi:tRNA pseudouridine(65) synthase TruC [Psychrosphaera haliotis]|uniref:tRNA pseudouridine(65) synthase TruC n=1 Tax=Psychrosphaera haliotis TaxID=555083 RepID=UPI0023720697|nr:tRNA pseudouridine(65) synthase TruC [Psychrosphaera haliotis]